MFVKLSYEPNVRENGHLIVILQETIHFPWYVLDYKNIEATFDWYVMSTEPSSILCLNSEHSAVDNSILRWVIVIIITCLMVMFTALTCKQSKLSLMHHFAFAFSLLQTASSMIASPSANNSEQTGMKSQMRAKRILYVKSIVRLLRLCGSKYQQLLTTADGSKSFNSAIFNLLTLISSIASQGKFGCHIMKRMNGIFNISLFQTKTTMMLLIWWSRLLVQFSCRANSRPGNYWMIHFGRLDAIRNIISFSYISFRIFVEAISSWQSTSGIGNTVLTSTLNALGACKSWTINILMLLESTIFYYFRYMEATREQHNPTWSLVIERLGPTLPPFDLQQLFDNEYLLCVHIYAIYKLKHLVDSGEKITYLENIGKLLENFKSTYVVTISLLHSRADDNK